MIARCLGSHSGPSPTDRPRLPMRRPLTLAYGGRVSTGARSAPVSLIGHRGLRFNVSQYKEIARSDRDEIRCLTDDRRNRTVTVGGDVFRPRLTAFPPAPGTSTSAPLPLIGRWSSAKRNGACRNAMLADRVRPGDLLRRPHGATELVATHACPVEHVGSPSAPPGRSSRPHREAYLQPADLEEVLRQAVDGPGRRALPSDDAVHP